MKNSSSSENKPLPYAPSWVDRLTAWVDGLPGPFWSYYLALGLMLLLVQFIPLIVEDAYPEDTFPALNLFLAAAMPFFLLMPHVLDTTAGAALENLRPMLKVDEEDYFEVLHYRLTKLPSRPIFLFSLAIVSLTTHSHSLLQVSPTCCIVSIPATPVRRRFQWEAKLAK